VPTFNANVLPSSTGFNLGSASQEWDAFIQQLIVSGTSTLDTLNLGLFNNIRIIDGTKFAATAAGLQEAIDEIEAAGGGMVFLPTSINIGTTTITLDGADQVSLVFLPGVILTYTGNSVALDIGTDSAIRHYISVINSRFDLDTAGSSAIAMRLTRTFNCLLQSPWIDGGTGTASDVAIQMRGGTSGANFGAYNKVMFPNIIGDWAKAVDIQAGGSSAGVNANQFYGGRIIRGTVTPATSTVGFHIQLGGTNRIWGTDIGGWDTGLQIASGANSNGPLAARFETNTTDWVVDSGALANSFVGATFSTFTDNGSNTQYSSHANGGLIQTLIQKLEAHSRLATEVALLVSGNPGLSAIGFTANQSGAVDAQIQRTSANTFVVDSNWGIRRASTGQAGFTTRLDTGDTFDRFTMTIGGETQLGSGVGAADVTWGRTAANELGPGVGDTLNVDRLRAAQGTALVAGDFALSAGFGTTATVTSVTGTDQRFGFTVNSSGTGQGADPTIILTFTDGAWTAAPFVVTGRTGGDQLAVALTVTTSTTTATITFRGTPIAAQTYGIECILMG